MTKEKGLKQTLGFVLGGKSQSLLQSLVMCSDLCRDGGGPA